MDCTIRPARRSLALTLCLTLFLASPGLTPYAALAGGLSSARGGRPARPVPGLPMSLGSPGLRGQARASTWASPAAQAGATIPGASVLSHAGAPSPPARSQPSAGPAHPLTPGPLAATASRASGLSAGVSGILEAAGELSRAQPGLARRTGQNIQDLLSGAKDQNFSSMSNPFSRSTGFSQAKPAGDLIRQSQQSYYQGQNPAPPQPPPGPPSSAGEGSGGPERRSPLWAKLVFAGAALLPAAFLGLPLLAGSALAASLVIASSAGLAALPFLVPAAPRLLRALPGAVLSALGLSVLGTLIAAFAWPAAITGALVFAGGWGLIFLSVDDKHRTYENPEEAMAAYLGAAGAIVAAGLLLLSPAGWLWTALAYASWAGPLILLRHMPGWVGEGIDTVYEGFELSIRDVYHALSSTRRDTLLFQRLYRFTQGALKHSPWHALWLGLLVWLPIGIVEAAQAALALALGLALGALRALPLVLWGAAHEIKADSWPTKLLATWSRSQFLINKAETFNPFERLFIPWANSESWVKRIPAGLGIRFTQMIWLLVLLATSPLLALWGPSAGLFMAGQAYDPKFDDPVTFDLPEDKLPDEVPDLPDKALRLSAWLPKLVSSGLGLLPAYFLGFPILLEVSPWLSFLYLAAVVAVASLPITPSGTWYPRWLRRVPGVLLGWAGAVALLTGSSLGMGLAASLGGIALYHLVGKLSDPELKSRVVDEPAYLVGYVGALGLVAGLGLALAGLPHWAGYLLSPLLLYHLPRTP